MTQIDAPTGLVARLDLYEATDLETANQRVAELVADDARLPRLNDAVYAAGWANSAAYAGDLDLFVGRLHPDFTAALVDGRVVGRLGLAAGDVAPFDVGFGTADRTLLAIRDDRLALIEIAETVDEVRHRRFAVEEISADGLVVASTLFAGDRCEDALSHLDARWLELCGDDDLAEMRARLVRTTTSVRRPDSDDFSALVSPGWHAVDHRSLGLLSMDADNRYEVHVAFDEEAVEGQVSDMLHPADVLRISLDGWVLCNVRRTLNEHGDEFVRTWLAAVEIDPDSDQHRSVHLFDPTDVDGAIAHLESMGASDRNESDGSPAPREAGEEQPDGFRELGVADLAADVVVDDRRVPVRGTDTDTGVEEPASFSELAQQFEFTPVQVFIRSRRLRLALLEGRVREGSDGEYGGLQVHRLDTKGRIELIVSFDEDQLRPAIAELNRLDVEMSDLQRRATVSALYDASAWSGRLDPEGYIMRPDVTWVDHRHMAINSNGLAEIVERNRQLHELVPDLHLFVGQIGLVEPPLFAGSIAYRGTTVDGADIDDGYAAVWQLDAPTGLIARADLYEASDLATASARRLPTRRRPRPAPAAQQCGLRRWLGELGCVRGQRRPVHRADAPGLLSHAGGRTSRQSESARGRRRGADRGRFRRRGPDAACDQGRSPRPDRDRRADRRRPAPPLRGRGDLRRRPRRRLDAVRRGSLRGCPEPSGRPLAGALR